MAIPRKRWRFPLNHRQRRREAAKIRRLRKRNGPPGPIWPALLIVIALATAATGMALWLR